MGKKLAKNSKINVPLPNCTFISILRFLWHCVVVSKVAIFQKNSEKNKEK